MEHKGFRRMKFPRLKIKITKKRLFIAIPVTLFLISFLFKNKKIFVREGKIERVAEFASSFSTQGKLQAAKENFLVLNRAGKIDRIFFRQGDLISENQVVAIVDELSAKSALKGALSNTKLAMANYGRVSNLYRSGSLPRQDLDEAETTLTVRKSELEAAKQKLEDSIARAPVAGRLSYLAFKEGDFVNPGSRLGIVESLQGFKLNAQVEEKHASELKKLKEIRFEISKAGAPSSPNTTAIGTVEVTDSPLSASQRNDISILFSSLPEGFATGDTVQIKTTLQTFKNIALIDPSILFVKEGKKSLLVVNENQKVSLFNPELGPETDDGRQIVLNLPTDLKIIWADPKYNEALLQNKLSFKFAEKM